MRIRLAASIMLGLAFALPAFAQAVTDKPEKTFNPRANCVRTSDAATELSENRLPSQPNLFSANYFLPTGSPIELVLTRDYSENDFYFGALRHRTGTQTSYTLLGRVSSAPLSDRNGLVTRGIAKPRQTLFTLRIPDSTSGNWSPVDVLVYTCKGSPDYISRLTARVTNSHASAVIAIAVVILAYVVGAAALADTNNGAAWWRRLNPVFLTAGRDGKGSLSNLQILFFSLIVFGLLTYIVARSGLLSDMSSSVLMLLGIAGVGSAAAKVTESQQNAITPENAAWLDLKGWNTSPPQPNKASWRDLFTTDNNFDVYRYQSFIFSLVVGGALLVAGVRELASFSIPDTLLGILGLSQAVYVTGKFVTPSDVGALNSAISAAREAEVTYLGTVEAQAEDFKLKQAYLERERIARKIYDNVKIPVPNGTSPSGY